MCRDVSESQNPGDAAVLGVIQQRLVSGHESLTTGNEESRCTEALMKVKVLELQEFWA